MQFLFVLVILIVLSIALAYRSLRHVQHLREIGDAQKELFKDKILFRRDHSSS